MAYAFSKDPLIRFLLSIGGLFLLWFLSYTFLIEPSGKVDLWLIDIIKYQSESILKFLDFQLLPESSNAEGDRYIGVQGGHYLWIGNPCNGLKIFAVFAIFIISYPGPIQHKLWFIPLGIILIHAINVIRVAALCIIVKLNPDLLSLNHDAVFYFIVYGCIIVLWYLWVKKFAGRSIKMA